MLNLPTVEQWQPRPVQPVEGLLEVKEERRPTGWVLPFPALLNCNQQGTTEIPQCVTYLAHVLSYPDKDISVNAGAVSSNTPILSIHDSCLAAEQSLRSLHGIDGSCIIALHFSSCSSESGICRTQCWCEVYTCSALQRLNHFRG